MLFRSPLSSEAVTGVSTCLSASPDAIEIPGSFPVIHVRAFGRVDRPTMPSADFSTALSANPSVPIDGRPRFVKRSIDDGEQVKIAAIDPDFAGGLRLGP